MKCTKVKDNIAAFYDNALSPDKRLKILQHLENCPECRTLYETMEGYNSFVDPAKNLIVQSNDESFINDLQQNIISTIGSLKANETPWDRFWNSKTSYYLSYSTAAIVLLFAFSFVFTTYFLNNSQDTNSSLISTNLSNSENAEDDNKVSNFYNEVPINFDDSVVASPIEENTNPFAYTFVMDNNKMITTYSREGERQQQVSNVNFRNLQETFGRITLQMGMYELAACPECAREYFYSVYSNEYLNGSPVKEVAGRYLSQLVVNE